MNIVKTCPLGSECEEIKDNKIHRCHFFTEIVGHDENGKETVQEECAISLLPMLLIENCKNTLKTTTATESFRNEMCKANNHQLELQKTLGLL